MKASKLRDMTVDELHLQETQLTDKVFRLRFQVAAGQVENPARVHLLRKDLARVKTILREKALAAQAPGAERMKVTNE
ncbi:MAG TPA: 50S ribosomal protein L29 [Candidatus Polarisedimenticolia bacterium]|jgi:large subunit ribosomal protein L29